MAMQNKTILLLSIPLAVLVIIVSCVGLFTPYFYSAETLNWQAQSLGQDLIDLFLAVPCLIIFSILAYRNKRSARVIWGGVVLYLTYTFVIYCFDIHFNKMFIIYCLCLGLSFYSLMYFLFTFYSERKNESLENKSINRIISIYFIFISVVFYFLWLSEILPSIFQNTIPKSIKEAGLPTNAVHVIDLSCFLPCIFLTGILLLKRKPLAFILTPILLTFFVLMDITIGMLVVIVKLKGLESDIFITGVMVVFALVSLVLLILFLKNIRTTIVK
jgi:hypothetical protein